MEHLLHFVDVQKGILHSTETEPLLLITLWVTQPHASLGTARQKTMQTLWVTQPHASLGTGQKTAPILWVIQPHAIIGTARQKSMPTFQGRCCGCIVLKCCTWIAFWATC